MSSAQFSRRYWFIRLEQFRFSVAAVRVRLPRAGHQTVENLERDEGYLAAESERRH